MEQIILAIRELHRQRQDLLRTEGDFTRRLKAMCRRAVGYDPDAPDEEKKMKMAQANALYKQIQTSAGIPLDDEESESDDESQPPAEIHTVVANTSDSDPLPPSVAMAAPALVNAQKMVRKERLNVERILCKQAEMLGAYNSFVKPLHGFGSLGFAQIIGEAGDLSGYANPAKLWKRMGMAVMGDTIQRKCLDAKKAEEHGYSPRRRSTMFVIGDSLLKKANVYKDLYDQRKVIEIEKAAAEGKTVIESAKIPAASKDLYRSKGHVHRRAKRYVEKRLLRDLWRAWRDLPSIEGEVA